MGGRPCAFPFGCRSVRLLEYTTLGHRVEASGIETEQGNEGKGVKRGGGGEGDDGGQEQRVEVGGSGRRLGWCGLEIDRD